MVNEEKVKELFAVARYDEADEKLQKQVARFYNWDYVWKEVLKSLISGTLAFLLLVVLNIVANAENILDEINDIDLVGVSVSTVLIYLAFMAVYIFITVLIYTARYRIGRKRLRRYTEHLRNVQRMYQREEKLRR